MPQHLDIAFHDHPPRRYRLYLGFRPPAAMRDRIVELAESLIQEDGLDSRPQRPDLLHMSVQGIIDLDERSDALVARIAELLSKLSLPAANIGLGKVGSFASSSNRFPLALYGDDLDGSIGACRAALASALLKAGLCLPRKTSFTPHVTLLYDSRKVAERSVPWIGWQAREIVLIESALGKAKHTDLGVWPLGG